MTERTFLTLGRREGIFKICLNILTILFAGMLASEFFIKFKPAIRIGLSVTLVLLVVFAIIVSPPHKNDGR